MPENAHPGPSPPNASSPKTRVLPSLLKVAECQIWTCGFWMCAVTLGCAGLEISQSWPSVRQAAAASFSSRFTVTSWHPWLGDVSNVDTDAFFGFDSGTFTTE